jgi:hypothetical protein
MVTMMTVVVILLMSMMVTMIRMAVLVPTVPGRHVRDVQTFAPASSSKLQELASFIRGDYPQVGVLQMFVGRWALSIMMDTDHTHILSTLGALQ